MSETGKDNQEVQTSSYKINEDTILVLKGTKKDRFFFMVADGISNCSYGSGYDASNILKRVCNFLWNEEEQYLENKEDIE